MRVLNCRHLNFKPGDKGNLSLEKNFSLVGWQCSFFLFNQTKVITQNVLVQSEELRLFWITYTYHGKNKEEPAKLNSTCGNIKDKVFLLTFLVSFRARQCFPCTVQAFVWRETVAPVPAPIAHFCPFAPLSTATHWDLLGFGCWDLELCWAVLMDPPTPGSAVI